MAVSIIVSTSVKMINQLGYNGEKEITKSRTISNLNTTASDEAVLDFGHAIAKLQDYDSRVFRADLSQINW